MLMHPPYIYHSITTPRAIQSTEIPSFKEFHRAKEYGCPGFADNGPYKNVSAFGCNNLRAKHVVFAGFERSQAQAVVMWPIISDRTGCWLRQIPIPMGAPQHVEKPYT
jgi:hypothetical protein